MQKPYNYFRSELKSKNIAKYKLIGITTEIILDNEIFKRNEDLIPFLYKVYNLNFKTYVINSRTLIIARTSRAIYELNEKETEDPRKKLLLFVSDLLDEKKVNENKNVKKDFTKWMDGIKDGKA